MDSKIWYIPVKNDRLEKKVGIYCRVSTNEREQLYSLAAQISALTRAVANVSQWRLADVFIDIASAKGEIHKKGISHPDACPFCNGKIPPQDQKSYIEASAAELQRIKLQLNDLVQAESDIVTERMSLDERLQTLLSEKDDVDALVNHELKPKVAELKTSLQNYRRAIEIQNESNLITGYETTLKSELFEKMTEEDSEIEFKIKNHYGRTILDEIDAHLTRILEACKFDSFNSAYLSLSSFDVVVNGKGKETYGKGYRAFLNTVVALAFFEYLSENGKYSPGFLAIDSPILSLKERGSEQASNSMKSALFTYLLDMPPESCASFKVSNQLVY